MDETDEASGRELAESVERGHERAGVNVRKVVMFGIGLFVLGVIIYIAVWGLFEYLAPPQANLYRMPPSSLDNTAQLPPEARMWANPGKDIQEMRASEERLLNNYGWVNKKAGIVRIPIDRAMELLIERGLPVRENKGGSEE